MPGTTANQSTIPYQQTNQWLQDLARKAGAGKVLWPPKPSVSNAREIVDAFLSYQKVNAGVMEQFMDSYLQFEQTGRTFPTEHALTKAILEDSASRAVTIPERNMVAFVSTSAQAVSSDAMFLRMTLDALEAGEMGNAMAPGFTASIQTGNTSNQQSSISAQAGVGASFFSLFKASASASAEIQNNHQTVRQVLATGKANMDARDRQALTYLSAIYGLEQSGVLPSGKFMNTFVRLSEISAEKTGNDQSNRQTAESLLTHPSGSLGAVNDAMMLNAHIRHFLLPFCADHLREALGRNPVEEQEVNFWSEARSTIQGRNIQESTLKMLTRYADHQDRPEPNMVVALLRMWDILSQTRKSAAEFLLSAKINDRQDYPGAALRSGDAIVSLALSPIIGIDKALVVTTNNRGGLAANIVLLQDVEDAFPAIQPVLTTVGIDCRMVKDDQWDAALEATAKINVDLMDALAQGYSSVLREDAQHPGKLRLVYGDLPADGPVLDSMSPWD